MTTVAVKYDGDNTDYNGDDGDNNQDGPPCHDLQDCSDLSVGAWAQSCLGSSATEFL